LAAASCVLSSCSEGDRGLSPPDRIFLVTIDTLRADHLGTYGYPRGLLPFLDSLAQKGVVFTDAQSSISHTAPSHASMFTGLQPAQHRLLRNGQKLATGVLSLAEVMKEMGYTTSAFTGAGFLRGVSQGFDHFERAQRYVTAPDVLRQAGEWLAKRPAQEKLFVWIHLYDVHEWIAGERRSDDDYRWMRDEDPTRERLWEYLQQENGLRPTKQWGRAILLDWHHRYDAQIRWVDRELGRFFEAQNASGLGASTAWIVTSDHGEGLGNHETKQHGIEVYREQLRIPLIFHFTAGSIEQGRRVDARVRLVDLGPTLADLVGGDFENQVLPVAGTSLLPLLEGNGAWHEPPIFAQRRPVDKRRLRWGWPPGDVYSLQLANQKIIVRTAGESELYDLATDPFESDNLFEVDVESSERLRRAAERRFKALTAQGRSVSGGEIQQEYRAELEALGYL